MGHISHDRHEDIRVFIRGESIFVKVAVELIEILFGVFLVAKDLDDLLSRDHFLNISVDRAERGLLLHEVLSARSRNVLRREDYKCYGDYCDKSEDRTERDHCAEHRHKSDKRRERLDKALRDHLSERIGIVRISAHYIAVRVGVEIFDRQMLHFFEHFVSDIAENALRHNDHYLRMNRGRNYTDKVYSAHY